MKNIVKGIIWILLVVGILFIAGWFLPRFTRAEKVIEVEASQKLVYAQINDLRNWQKWAVWMQDISVESGHYTGYGVGEGAGYIWKAQEDDTTHNALQVEKSVPYDSLVVSVDIEKYDPARSLFWFYHSDSTTVVKWMMEFDAGNDPLERWAGLLSRYRIAPAMEQSLDYLKVVSEIQAAQHNYIPEVAWVDSFVYAGVREYVPYMEVGIRMGEMYGMITTFLESAPAGLAGVPFAIYHGVEGEVIDLECGIPVSENVQGSGMIRVSKFPRIRCVAVDYHGDYQDLEDAHTAVQAWIDERKFKIAGPPIEFYMTDASMDQDPQGWHTRIFYPVE